MKSVTILDKDVIQANPLIRAKKEMNLAEMRLFILGLQDIKPHIKDDNFHDVDFHETIITYNELVDLFGKEYYGNITNLKKQVKKAYQGAIELSYDDGGFGFRHIYKKIDYIPKKGLVIQFDDEIKPYILEILNQPYTKCKVKAFFSLSSVYAWRILESLLEKQGFLKQGHKEIFLVLTIEELRFRLNISEGLYKGKMSNFRSRILDLPIKEINEKTDYFVWYEVQKTGRKVTGFKFWLKLKKNIDVKSIEEKSSAQKEHPVTSTDILAPMPKSSKEELVMALTSEGMVKASINTWLKTFGEADVTASMRLAIDHANKKELHGISRKKYIKSCMERNISASNANEARQRKEIDDREKRVAEEKKQATKAMTEGFAKIGLSFGTKSKGLQSVSSIIGTDKTTEEELKPQELSDDTIKCIAGLYRENNNRFDVRMQETLKKYGYTAKTFMPKYFGRMLEYLQRD